MANNADQCKQREVDANGTKLKVLTIEVDLGVTISNSLKAQSAAFGSCKERKKKISKKKKNKGGLISRSLEYKSKDIVLTIYDSSVRSYLEYCVQAWCLYYREDKDKLELVHFRMTEIIPNLRNKPHGERIKEIYLFPLTQRKPRGDLKNFFFLIIKGIDNINCSKYFTNDH